MEEKPIIIKIENYNNEKITFTMPSNATIESMFEMNSRTFKVDRVFIDAQADNIEIEKEDLTNGI